MARKTLYIIVGAIALLLILGAVGIFALMSAVTSAHSSQTATTPVVSPTTTTKQAGNGTGKILKQYAPDIKNQVAQGLHMTSDQLTAQLQSGKTLSEVATAQGVSSSQLQTIVSSALQTSLKPAVDNGDMTQKQLDKLAKRYENNPDLLDKLLGGKAFKGTPTATPAQ